MWNLGDHWVVCRSICQYDEIVKSPCLHVDHSEYTKKPLWWWILNSNNKVPHNLWSLSVIILIARNNSSSPHYMILKASNLCMFIPFVLQSIAIGRILVQLCVQNITDRCSCFRCMRHIGRWTTVIRCCPNMIWLNERRSTNNIFQWIGMVDRHIASCPVDGCGCTARFVVWVLVVPKDYSFWHLVPTKLTNNLFQNQHLNMIYFWK